MERLDRSLVKVSLAMQSLHVGPGLARQAGESVHVENQLRVLGTASCLKISWGCPLIFPSTPRNLFSLFHRLGETDAQGGRAICAVSYISPQ